jgi:hypothetical protein
MEIGEFPDRLIDERDKPQAKLIAQGSMGLERRVRGKSGRASP